MRIELRAGTPVLHALTREEGDCGREEPGRLLWMTQTLHLIHRFEATLLDLKAKDLVHGSAHTSIGQEAVAVGAAFALRAQDKIAGTQRAHHHYLVKAIAALVREGLDPRGGLTENMHEAVRVLLSEVMGLRDGCSGGSMHLYNPALGIAGINAIVGDGIPMATGGAWADLKNRLDWITVCFFGDGALYQGTQHKSANLVAP
jgi:2-oxoisovalerate dehydrogenase E1 component